MTDSSGALLRELQRQCDALLAAASDAPAPADIAAQLPRFPGDALTRLEWTSATVARRQFLSLARLLLSWTSTPPGSCTNSRSLVAWLSAHLLIGALEALSSRDERHQLVDAAALDAVLALVLDRSFQVLRDVSQQRHALGLIGDSAPESSSALGFFAFKATPAARPAHSADTVLLDSVATKWRSVLAWVAKVYSAALVRVRLQREVTRWTTEQSGAKPPASQQLPLVSHLAELQLGISSARSNSTFARNLLGDVSSSSSSGTLFTHRLKDGALLLKTLHPLLQKPTRAAIRVETFALVAAILKRELLLMDETTAALLYTTAHVSEWNSCLCDMHALAMKCTTKKEFVAVGWELRIAVLSSLPNDIFARYWKDDVHALLRLRYQHNKDGSNGKVAAATLECIGFCLVQMLQRHFLVDRTVPTDLDCMEVINTTQAWCFFSLQKQKSLHKFKMHVLPSLVRVSLGIGAYNMTYAVQSHLRRLFMEAESIFDEKKLVGLESLLAIYRHCYGGTRQENGESARCRSGAILDLDKKILETNSRTLGEIVGHILIECNSNLGHELLIDTIGASCTALIGGSGNMNSSAPLAQSSTSSTLASRFLRDDFKRSLAIQTFGAALQSLEFMYEALELSDDQKMLLIAKASIHTDVYVRECASQALHSIVTSRGKYQGATVFRGLTDFLLRMTGNQPSKNDIEACVILTKLLGSLLRAAIEAFATEARLSWENEKVKDESLLQVEAVCVFLLSNDDEILCGCVIDTLAIVRSGCTTTDRKSSRESTATRSAPQHLVGMRSNAGRLCVLDVVESTESELQTKFFSFLPDHELRRIAGNAESVPFFRHLAADTQYSRRSFRWSMCLSMLYEHLAHYMPEVTVYIWSDVNDKILKTEPMIPSSSGESEAASDVARWRNLSILATVSACSSFSGRNMHTISAIHPRDGVFRSELDSQSLPENSSIQSAISASAVTSLLKRLARYLRSPSMTQRKSAILALGSTNPSFLPVLIEVLAKYEVEAFESKSPESTSIGEVTRASHCDGGNSIPAAAHGGLWKQPRLNKVKSSARLFGSALLQWAIGRCYRLLLERLLRLVQQHDDPDGELACKSPASLGSLGSFLQSARSVLEKISTGLEKHGRAQTLDAVRFMTQQDFCLSMRTIVQFDREKRLSRAPDADMKSSIGTSMARGDHETSTSSFRSECNLFPSHVRENLFCIMASWCEPIGALVVPALAANVDSTGFIFFTSPYWKVWMQHCDVFGDRVGEDLVISSHWCDEDDISSLVAASVSVEATSTSKSNNGQQLVTLLQRYFLCQTAFAAMAAMVDCSSMIFSPPISSDSLMFRWLDECFCVQSKSSEGGEAPAESPHFGPLQRICSHTLQVLLVQDFGTFSPICIEKALFTHAQGDKFVMAKHYFAVISDTMARMRDIRQPAIGDDKSGARRLSETLQPLTSQLLVQFFHAALLHVGVEDSEMHRVKALSFIKCLLECSATALNGDALVDALAQQHGMSSSRLKCLPVLLTQTTNRLQIAVSSLLAPNFPMHAVRMCSTFMRFIAYCDLPQQRKLFAAVLPWLAEVCLLTSAKNLPSTQSEDSAQLLSIMFRLTRNLSALCSIELEHAWQTLGFTAHNLDSADASENTNPMTNLPAILSFLFYQRGTAIQLATSRTVMWWLSRWQGAVFDCVAGLLDIVTVQRRRNAHLEPGVYIANTENQRNSGILENVTTAKLITSPLSDAAVVLTLLADSSCNLQLSQIQDATATSDMALQIVHLALLMLFCTINLLSGDSRAHSSPCANFLESANSEIFDSIAHDCILVLRNVLPWLQVSGMSLDHLIHQLSQLMEGTHNAGLQSKIQEANEGKVECDHRAKLSKFGNVISIFAQTSLQPPDVALWSEECVKEFAMAISLFSANSRAATSQETSLLQQPNSMDSTRLQNNLCLRFALRMHRHLAAPFHGDVFLVLTELLHHSLDEQIRAPFAAQELVRECLLTLKAMVALMPTSQLVLYPQILWVCIALLNHCKPSIAHHRAVVALLFEILNKPHFFTNVVLQDVLVCKRPQHWSKAQSSILRAIALNMFYMTDDNDGDIDDMTIHDQRLETVMTATIFSCPILIADENEHAVICTIALMPYLTAEDTEYPDAVPLEQLVQIATDLRNLWSDIDGEEAKELRDYFENSYTTRSVPASKAVQQSFASRFVAYLRRCLNANPSFDGACVCVEVLVAAAESGQRRSGDISTCELRRRLASASLFLLQELLIEMESCQLAWRMPSGLVASLTELVQEPRDDAQWRARVAILSYLDMAISQSAGIPSNPPSSSAITSELAVSTGVDVSRVTEVPPTCAKPETPMSNKKETLQTARKFFGLMTGRSSSSRSPKPIVNANSGRSNNNNNNSDGNQCNSSSSSSSSILTGSHPIAEVSHDLSATAVNPTASAHPLEKANDPNDDGDDSHPLPSPTPAWRTRKFF